MRQQRQQRHGIATGSVFSVYFVPSNSKVKVKAASDVHPINKAQLLSYMKLLDIPLGLIINFNQLKLTDGVSRLSFPESTRPEPTEETEETESSTLFPPFSHVQRLSQRIPKMPKLILSGSSESPAAACG